MTLIERLNQYAKSNKYQHNIEAVIDELKQMTKEHYSLTKLATEQAVELDKLKDDLEIQLINVNCMIKSKNYAFEALAKVLKERDELKADAIRYRWFRENIPTLWFSNAGYDHYKLVKLDVKAKIPWDATQLDSAIDAAMEEK